MQTDVYESNKSNRATIIVKGSLHSKLHSFTNIHLTYSFTETQTDVSDEIQNSFYKLRTNDWLFDIRRSHWHTLAFWTGLPLESSLMSTVDVTISAFTSQNISKLDSLIVYFRKVEKKIEVSLFSTASPLFFRISAIVTTVAIAAAVQ